MFTREQYLNKEVSHHEYYLEIAKECGIDYSNSDLLPDIVTCLLTGDNYLNKIPLRSWDSSAYWTQRHVHFALKKRGDFWSLANGVCTHKAAARQAGLDFIANEKGGVK